jgi:EmrB/QacA subfamily drug resistance transporter
VTETRITTDKMVALLIATLGSFLTPFMGSAVIVALPAMARDFHLNAIEQGWVTTSYLLATAVFLVPFGKIADMVGRKRIFTYGIALWAGASLLCAIAPSAHVLIWARVLQGLASAMIFGTGIAIVTSIFAPGERGLAIGITIGAVYLGLSLGPVLGGLLTHSLGWRSIFYVNVPPALFVVALIAWGLHGEWAEARGERFDWLGALLYSVALVALMYGLTLLPAPRGFGLIALGAVLTPGFVWWENHRPNPVLDLRLFRHNTVFAFSNLAALIHYSATFALNFLLGSFYLQSVRGFDPRYAGLILAAQPVMMAAFSPFAGKLSDRVDARIVASAGIALTGIGIAAFIPLTRTTPLAFIVVDLAMIGFGYALFSSPNTNAIMSAVERRFYGMASATLSTMRLIGGSFSMGIAILLLALYVGKANVVPENFGPFMTSMRVTFAICAALCVAGFFASLARGRSKSRSDEGVLQTNFEQTNSKP